MSKLHLLHNLSSSFMCCQWCGCVDVIMRFKIYISIIIIIHDTNKKTTIKNLSFAVCVNQWEIGHKKENWVTCLVAMKPIKKLLFFVSVLVFFNYVFMILFVSLKSRRIALECSKPTVEEERYPTSASCGFISIYCNYFALSFNSKLKILNVSARDEIIFEIG